jgi:hypothetical protein
MSINNTVSKVRLQVHWFDQWTNELDSALQLLPEMAMCPHALYRDLANTDQFARKRYALVTHGDEPVSVVIVRLNGIRWEPVTTWIVPGALFPVRTGYLIDVLCQLNVPLFIAWWRQDVPPPQHPRFQQMHSVVTRRLACQEDYEAYWKQTGKLVEVRKARRKCEHLKVTINAPGAAAWTIENWGRRWAQSEVRELIDTRDRLRVARYWEPRGHQFTISLMDEDRFVASGTVFVHGNDVVGQANYRDPVYEKLGVGTRMIDAVQSWAAQAGFENHDFGGGLDYKNKWAPEAGERWDFILEPPRGLLRTFSASIWRQLRKP